MLQKAAVAFCCHKQSPEAIPLPFYHSLILELKFSSGEKKVLVFCLSEAVLLAVARPLVSFIILPAV